MLKPEDVDFLLANQEFAFVLHRNLPNLTLSLDSNFSFDISVDVEKSDLFGSLAAELCGLLLKMSRNGVRMSYECADALNTCADLQLELIKQKGSEL